MANRVAVFKSQKGYFMTPIFPQTLPWPKIVHKLIQTRTLEEFEEVCAWAQGAKVERMSRTYEGRGIDEHLLVYEDLGTTGFSQNYKCPNCGYTEQVKFFPNGKSGRVPNTCIQCGEKMQCETYPLTAEMWKVAVDMLHSKPGEFLVDDRPVKILKIIGFNGGDIQHQILYRDWTTAITNKLGHYPEDDIPHVRQFWIDPMT